jgi:hypothetical protein
MERRDRPSREPIFARNQARAYLPIVGSVWMSVVARASCPWVCARPFDMGKMPMPLAPPSIGRCARQARRAISVDSIAKRPP